MTHLIDHSSFGEQAAKKLAEMPHSSLSILLQSMTMVCFPSGMFCMIQLMTLSPLASDNARDRILTGGGGGEEDSPFFGFMSWRIIQCLCQFLWLMPNFRWANLSMLRFHWPLWRHNKTRKCCYSSNAVQLKDKIILGQNRVGNPYRISE